MLYTKPLKHSFWFNESTNTSYQFITIEAESDNNRVNSSSLL